MKKITLLLLLCGIFGFSQKNDTIWYDKDWKLTTMDNAEYYRPPAIKKGNKYEFTDYYADGKVQMRGLSTKKDTTAWDGKLIWYDEEGNIESEGNFMSGKANGEAASYYPNKQIKVKFNVKDNKREGLYTEYYENGQLYGEVVYKNGNPDGVLKQYYRDGQLQVTKEYANGQQHGKETGYYADGTIRYSGMVVDGNPAGEYVKYQPNGKLLEKVNYVDGKPTDKHYYNKSGNEIQMFTPKMDTPEGKAEAKKITQDILDKRKIVAKQEAMVKPLQDSSFIVKYGNGRQAVTGAFYEGKRYYTWEYFDKSGNKVMMENYHNGFLDSTQQFYDKNGTVIFDTTFSRGKLHGLSTTYDEKGETKSYAFFILGKPVTREEFDDGYESKFYSGEEIVEEAPVATDTAYITFEEIDNHDGLRQREISIDKYTFSSLVEGLDYIKLTTFDTQEADRISHKYALYQPDEDEIAFFYVYDEAANISGMKKFKLGSSVKKALADGSLSAKDVAIFISAQGYGKATYWSVLLTAELKKEAAKR